MFLSKHSYISCFMSFSGASNQPSGQNYGKLTFCFTNFLDFIVGIFFGVVWCCFLVKNRGVLIDFK